MFSPLDPNPDWIQLNINVIKQGGPESMEIRQQLENICLNEKLLFLNDLHFPSLPSNL